MGWKWIQQTMDDHNREEHVFDLNPSYRLQDDVNHRYKSSYLLSL